MISPTVLEITADSEGPSDYFPEKFLCEWFRSRHEEVPIATFLRTCERLSAEAYAAVDAEYDIDTALPVDGGTDSLMRGDEPGLGIPQDDICSIVAVDALGLERRFVACVEFGIDRYHGESHGCFVENVAALTKCGAFLGVFSLLSCMEEARLYRGATEFVFTKMPHHPSIVSSSILSAVAGEIGDHHATRRTRAASFGSIRAIRAYQAELLDRRDWEDIPW